MSNMAADFKVHITRAGAKNENIYIVDEKMQGRFIHVFTAQDTDGALLGKTFSQGVNNNATLHCMLEQILDVYGYNKVASMVEMLCFDRAMKQIAEVFNEKDKD